TEAESRRTRRLHLQSLRRATGLQNLPGKLSKLGGVGLLRVIGDPGDGAPLARARRRSDTAGERDAKFMAQFSFLLQSLDNPGHLLAEKPAVIFRLSKSCGRFDA